eukprot:1195998-Prorocentrum_minimum.AAC.5
MLGLSGADKINFHVHDHTDLYTVRLVKWFFAQPLVYRTTWTITERHCIHVTQVKRDRDVAWNATAPLRGSITSFGGLNNILSFFRGNHDQPTDDVPKTHRGQHSLEQPKLVNEEDELGACLCEPCIFHINWQLDCPHTERALLREQHTKSWA